MADCGSPGRKSAGCAATPWGLTILTALMVGNYGDSALASDISLTAGAFGSGYTLPLNSLGGLLGWVAIGLWSGRLGGLAVWFLPLLALGAAFAGALAAGAGFALPYSHHGLLAAVAVLGGLRALGVQLRPLPPAFVVGATALFVGQPLALAAHGPQLWPWLGFAVSAGLAMLGGLGLATLFGGGALALGVRGLGAAIAGTGVLLLLDRL